MTVDYFLPFRITSSKLTNFNLKNFNSHANHHYGNRKYRAKINFTLKTVAQL